MGLTARRHYYTPDEYFALECASDARYEYWDGDIFCMSGGSPQHGQIVANIVATLFMEARKRGCRALTGDQAVHSPAMPPYRYPDASVVCGEPQYRIFRGIAALVNPIIIVEVLSPESEGYDFNEKRIAYQALTTLREYLLIAQNTPRVTCYGRSPDTDWFPQVVEGFDSVLTLPSLGAQIPLRAIYENVDFPDEQH